MRRTKKVDASITEQQYMLRSCHMNYYGRLFGGQLLMWIDELAGIVATRHCNATVTTASIDNLQFQAPAYEGDTIVLQGMMTYVGRSSMEIRVDTFVEDLNGARKIINRAYIVMVAIDKDGKAVEVPGLVIETEAQQAEYEAAIKRKQMGHQRRKGGF